MPTTTDPFTIGDVVEMYADAGLAPANLHELEWVRGTYEAAADYHGDVIGATLADGAIDLYVMTRAGVMRSHARFGLNRFGAAMFVGAVAALFGTD